MIIFHQKERSSSHKNSTSVCYQFFDTISEFETKLKMLKKDTYLIIGTAICRCFLDFCEQSSSSLRNSGLFSF